MRKLALVTGATRGIARAIAIDLAKEGVDDIVNYRSRPDAAEDVVKEINGMGVEAISIKTDIANESEVWSMIDLAIQSMSYLRWNKEKI